MVVKILEDKSKHLSVEIFTTKATGNTYHRKALRRLRGPIGFLKKVFGRKKLKVRMLPDNFHAKVFLIDDVVVLGSANATYAGIRKNFETVTICRDLEIVMEVENYFAKNFG